MIIGVATFFDAFDALVIASVLPAIVPMWKLTPPQIGILISAGFLGQLLGALFFGWIAENYGRMTGMIWSIGVFAVGIVAASRQYRRRRGREIGAGWLHYSPDDKWPRTEPCDSSEADLRSRQGLRPGDATDALVHRRGGEMLRRAKP